MATTQVIVVVDAPNIEQAKSSASTATSNAADTSAFLAPLIPTVGSPGSPTAYWTSWFMEGDLKTSFLEQLQSNIGSPDVGTYRVYDGAVTEPEAVLLAEGLKRLPVGDV